MSCSDRAAIAAALTRVAALVADAHQLRVELIDAGLDSGISVRRMAALSGLSAATIQRNHNRAIRNSRR